MATADLGDRRAESPRRLRRAVPTGRGRRWPTPLLAALVAVILLAELAVRIGAGQLPSPMTWSTPEAQHKADQLSGWARRYHRAEVVVFGASMADNGFDPTVIDASLARVGAAYNASLVGTSLDSIALWATRFVVPKLHPRVVVLGVSPVELNPNVPGEQAAITAFRNAPSARYATGRESLLDKGNRLLGDVSWLFRYRTVLRSPSQWTAGRSNGAAGVATVNDPALTADGMNLTGRDTPYGTFLGKPVPSAVRLGQYEGDLFHRFVVGTAQTAALAQFVLDLRRAGSEVVIVDLPLTADAEGYLPHGASDVAATASALQRVASAAGARFVPTGIWPTSLFADPGHLNGRGAAALTAQVLPVITALLGPDGSTAADGAGGLRP
jgi:hypothetical protein